MSEGHPVDELRKLEPSSLKVYLLDGTEKPVAVPKVRNRWARVIQVIDALAWTRIEALDAKGMVLGQVETEIDDDEEDDDDGQAGDRDMRIARVLLEVMRTTQKETRQMFDVQMKGQAALVEAMIAGMSNIAQSYEHSMAVQRAGAIAEAGASAGGNPEIMAMLQLAMSSMNRPAVLPSPVKPERKP